MLRPFLAASAVCLLAATPAAYADLSYSYVEGAVFDNSTDTSVSDDEDGKGFEGRFSYDVLQLPARVRGHQIHGVRRRPRSTRTLIEAGAGVHYSTQDAQQHLLHSRGAHHGLTRRRPHDQRRRRRLRVRVRLSRSEQVGQDGVQPERRAHRVQRRGLGGHVRSTWD